MSGRILFVLSVIFVGVALLSYDTNVRRGGGRTGLSDTIDKVKNIKLPNVNIKSLFPSSKAYPSFINIQREFSDLQNQSLKFKEQRNKIVQDRKDILDEFRLANNNFSKELSSYEASFYKDRNLWESYGDLKKASQSMNYEYEFLKQNMEATENQFEKLLSLMEQQIGNVVIEVVSFGPQDLLRLTDFHLSLTDSEGNLSINLQQHYQRFWDQQKNFNNRIQGILQEAQKVNIGIDENSFKNLQTTQDELFQKLKTNTAAFMNFCNEQTIAYYHFINRMAESIEVDLNQLLEERAQAQRQ